LQAPRGRARASSVASRQTLRFNARMPELTRRRSANHRQECWHIYHGDIHAGMITERVGNPHDADPWEWHCGFYPGSHPSRRGECFYQNALRPIFGSGAISGIGPRENMPFGMQADGLSRRATVRANPAAVSGSAPAAIYSTCRAPRKYSCMCPTSLQPKRYKRRSERMCLVVVVGLGAPAPGPHFLCRNRCYCYDGSS
jgi:hypothetical protein